MICISRTMFSLILPLKTQFIHSIKTYIDKLIVNNYNLNSGFVLHGLNTLDFGLFKFSESVLAFNPF